MDRKRNPDSLSIEEDEMEIDQSQPLLPDGADVQKVKARRKIHIFSLIVASLACLLQLIVLPINYPDFHRLWATSEYIEPITIGYYLVYGCAIFSCIFSPLIIRIFGPKISLLAGSVFVTSYAISNFSPLLHVYIPGAAFGGIGWGLMLTTQGALVTSLSVQYGASVDRQEIDSFVNIFHGVFFFFILAAPVFRYSILLMFSVLSDKWAVLLNSSVLCGSAHCPPAMQVNSSYHMTLVGQNIIRVEAMLGIYLTISVVGVLLVAIFLRTSDKGSIGLKEFLSNKTAMTFATFLMWRDYKLRMMWPIFVYIGMQQTFLYTVYMESFVECPLSSRMMGYTILCAAGCSCCNAPLTGMLLKYIGRLKVFVLGNVMNLIVYIVCLVWEPDPLWFPVFFVLPAIAGSGNGIVQTQSSALLGLVFPTWKEAAFSNYRIGQIVGIIAMLTMKRYMCTTACTFLMIASLVLATGACVVTEIRVKLDEQERRSQIEQKYMMPDLGDLGTWLPSLDPHDNSRCKQSLNGKKPNKQSASEKDKENEEEEDSFDS